MAYHYENLKLEKGMYSQSGRSFAQTLEALDPSENYKGTSLEGLDAFQRQLKRFDIKVKGAGSDRVEKFFWSTESAVLFPEFVSRVVRQGMEEESILPDITATVTNFDGMDYRSIASTPTEEEKKLKRVEEGAQIPQTTIHTQENLVRLHKRGRMLVAPYEAIRFQRLDLFAVTLRSRDGEKSVRAFIQPAAAVRCQRVPTSSRRGSPGVAYRHHAPHSHRAGFAVSGHGQHHTLKAVIVRAFGNCSAAADLHHLPCGHTVASKGGGPLADALIRNVHAISSLILCLSHQTRNTASSSRLVSACCRSCGATGNFFAIWAS